jgi:hypothetical protein
LMWLLKINTPGSLYYIIKNGNKLIWTWLAILLISNFSSSETTLLLVSC